MKTVELPLITIDGPGATGKSTVAWEVSKRLGLHFLNSGTLYRIAAYYVYDNKFSIDDIEKITHQINMDQITFKGSKNNSGYMIYLNDKDVTSYIRLDTIASLASTLSKNELLRRALVKKQQDFYQKPGLVADGRDMGTCIFPEAKYKFFLTASAKIRAERRYKELQKSKINANFTDVFDSLVKRDEQDVTRSVSPLVIPPGAIVIDTSNLSLEEVIEEVVSHCCINEWC